MSYPFSSYNFPSDHPTRSYQSGQVNVTSTTTPTLIVSVTGNQSGVLISTTTDIYIGGSTVSSSTGYKLSAGTSATLPSNGGVTNQLYAVASSTASLVNYLYPSR